MIATCPACAKRYRLSDDAVPAGGRSVRCAACSHGWTVLPGGAVVDEVPPAPLPRVAPSPARPAEQPVSGPAAAPIAAAPGTAADLVPRPLPVPATIAVAPPPQGAVPTLEPTLPFAAALPAVAAPEPAGDLSFTQIRDAMNPPPRPRRRKRGWIVAAVLVPVALGALAVVEFAPEDTFSPPRLGLPAARLPLADLGSFAVPTLPPLDLTRVPLIGDRLDALVNPPPPPASPLRIVVSGERRRLANGTWLLTVTGTVANPSAAPVALARIDAALIDPSGHLSFRWRIAAPVGTLAPHASVAFESTAANFPPAATILRLTPR